MLWRESRFVFCVRSAPLIISVGFKFISITTGKDMCQNASTPFVSGKLHCPSSELQLQYTLNGGQSFRWKEYEKDQWIGAFADRVWVLTRNNDSIEYKVYNKDRGNKKNASQCKKAKNYSDVISEDLDINKELLIDYFRLNASLKELYNKWSEADSNFKEASEMFYGIRIMKQNPVENIFSFICSSNNFISRISSMVEKLCTFYGEKICNIDGKDYFSFPTVDKLAQPGVEENLRQNGFGYRAKYIHQSAGKIISFGGTEWLNRLKEMNYSDAKLELMKLSGIGAKVADCICLMSLGHLEAVPVDTHVFQIASQYYLTHLKSVKSVNTKIYNEIGDHFRTLYGPSAGWAHTILFCADLKKFQTPSTTAKRKATAVNKSKRAKQ